MLYWAHKLEKRKESQVLHFKINKKKKETKYQMNVPLSSFNLNAHTPGFYLQMLYFKGRT